MTVTQSLAGSRKGKEALDLLPVERVIQPNIMAIDLLSQLPLLSATDIACTSFSLIPMIKRGCCEIRLCLKFRNGLTSTQRVLMLVSLT
jgi:hypothetical protein